MVNDANSTDPDSLCESNRGGVFDPFKSSTWHNEGLFDLGADTRLGNQGYALYGLDDLTYGSTGVVQSSAIIGQVNDTGLATSFQTWLGFFGLGIVPGNFTDVSSLSSISALVEKVAVIPSHSYGYTAGAKYREFLKRTTFQNTDTGSRTKGSTEFVDSWWLRRQSIRPPQHFLRIESQPTAASLR